MCKKFLVLLIACACLSFVLSSQLLVSASNQFSHLTLKESQVISLINGTSAYNYDLELERIGLNHSLSGYSFRSSGSPGANQAANWVKEQFENLHLEETHLESFEFTNWDLLTQPILVIDDDGNENTTDDQVICNSFQSEHYSWPTPQGGIFSELVTLPLPEAETRELVGTRPYNASAWNAVDTTGKILLIGREIRWSDRLQQVFVKKLSRQPPAAVIFTWWYDWMSWAPPSFSSVGGRPASMSGSYFWDLKIPSGWVDYQDGLWIRNRKTNSTNLSAHLTIQATIGSGLHYNVIGKLTGSVSPEKMIIVSGHYDTVVNAGFCDNGAGTAGVIELARVFSEAYRQSLYKPESTLVFIAFTGEELGLIGAVEYLKQHENELKNILAVINLDCIGGETMEISEAFLDDNGMNLQDIVANAANDLGVPVIVAEPGGSDQEAFRNPASTDDTYRLFWGSRPNIGNFTRVKSSIMISSYPLFLTDLFANYTLGPGWIHTPYDNSTSTETLGWVTVNNLESQIQVAGVAVMRVLAMAFNPFVSQIFSVVAVTGIALAGVIFYERVRVRAFLKKAHEDVLSHIESREFLYIIALTAFFMFTSFIVHTRVARVEIVSNGYPTIVLFEFVGAPFEMIAMGSPAVLAVQDTPEAMPIASGSYQGSTVIIWQGVLLNLALCILLAFSLTYAVSKIKARREYVESQKLTAEMRFGTA